MPQGDTCQNQTNSPGDTQPITRKEVVFPIGTTYLFDVDVIDNHIYNLSKQVLELYVKIRLHHMAKERNQELVKDKVRSVLSRVIIYKNQ
uniref:Uncharacterized protein n=1 Tax=Rhipicephalus appendiculatus TaxID=34631 RepID=A0A131YFZ6_RHIAP